MAKHRRRKQKNRDRATGKNNPVHHEAAPRAVQRPTADAPPAPEQPTTMASTTSAAQNPEPSQAHQAAPQGDPRAEPAITDPEPTARDPARSLGSMVEVNDKADWEVTPYRPPTVTRAKTRMQLGEWEQLAELDGNEVIGGAPITELQLMAAVGRLQKGGESARDRARTLLLDAMYAGADRKQIARMLIAGASNTLGRLAALTGRSDQKVLEHFRSAISISDPEADVDLMLHPMAARQLGRLATKTGSKSIQEMAQRAALGMASLGPHFEEHTPSDAIWSCTTLCVDARARPRVAVAGIPRSGTTMVFRAIAGLPPGSTTPKDYAGPHVKTHTFEPSTLQNKVDVAIFMFGDVVDSVVSTRENRFDKGHFRNCGANHLSLENTDLYEADHLNYEQMFDAWMRPNGIPHICVNYERIHELAAEVETLLGCPMPLPDKEPRKTKVSDQIRMRIKQSYSSLIHKVRNAPDLSYYK